MAVSKKTLGSLKKPKAPKKPGLKASPQAFRTYEIKKKDYDAKVRLIDSEIARRKKILNK